MIENIPIIKSIIELLAAIWSLIRQLFGGKGKSNVQIDIPKKTIIVAPNPNPRGTWWHMGSPCQSSNASSWSFQSYQHNQIQYFSLCG